MRNLIKRISALLLCLLLVLSLPVTALAEEAKDTDEAAAAEEGTTLRILRQKQFLDFAENCRLDSYSRNLSVVLLPDIDLTRVDFAGIPIFCGNFAGNGHTVSGLSITQDGSNMGLFRYVDASAVIQNLTVSGAVTPDGSRSAVGGIAGHNAGKILICFFDGTVSGSDDVGGIAGINRGTLGGTSGSCLPRQAASVRAESGLAGGIAGAQEGAAARLCFAKNLGRVTANTGAAGGIVGISSAGSAVENCYGDGSVASSDGYAGGIAGDNLGRIQDCAVGSGGAAVTLTTRSRTAAGAV